MPTHIIRVEADGRQNYLLWSTVVDAPTWGPGTRNQMRNYAIRKWGTDQTTAIDGMLERADAHGTSRRGETDVTGTIDGNRAGENETELSLGQIIDVYVRGKPNVVGTCDDGDEDTTTGDASP